MLILMHLYIYSVSTASKVSATDEEEYIYLKKATHMMVQLGVCQLLPLWVLFMLLAILLLSL